MSFWNSKPQVWCCKFQQARGGGGLLDTKGIPHKYRGIVSSSLRGYLARNMFDHVKVLGKFVCWRLLRRAVVSRVGHFGQLREQFLRSQGVVGE